MPRDGSDEVVADLWAMAAELERQFAGYKQRLAAWNGDSDAAAARDGDASGDAEPGGDDDSCDVRPGRMYEAYVRRRDERLRQGWRARMERKEAEVKALWAQLELAGRAGGRERAPPAGAAPTTAGDEEVKTERNDDDKKRSSDTALAPRRISGKKHARTMSFSSSTNAVTNRHDVGRRRALSQEPPPSSEGPQAAPGDASKETRARPAAAKVATLRPKTSSRRKSSVRGHGSAKQSTAGLKQSRSLPRRGSSGRLVDQVVPPSADAPAPVLSRSDEQDARGETSKDSPPRPSTGGGTGATNVQATSPDSDRSEVVDAVPNSEPEAKKRGDEEEVDASSPDKLGNPNGEITSCDSDIESTYVYVNKDTEPSLPETPAAPVAERSEPDLSVKNNEEAAKTTTPPAGATARETIAATKAEEAPARASSGESSFSGSGRLGRSPTSSAAPSCSSRDQSIERVLEADAALLRKKREGRTLKTSTTPGSAGSRPVSGTAGSPKATPKGFKRFLSFRKKNRSREVPVIDCASPSVSSVADDDSGRWQSAGSIKPRMGSSDAASDDTDHGRPTSPRVCSLQSLVTASPAKSELVEIAPQVKSPKAHRSFFSFRALNCGRVDSGKE